MSGDGPERLAVPMRPRSPEEEHRAATPLELFFDLVFVVAIAQAATELHHGIAAAHVGEALLSYALVFFAIWWAWMNFTWLASAYDPGDALYRVIVFIQLTGALILAAGVEQAFAESDWRLVAGGYLVMRLALVTQWLRAARADPPRAPCAYRYAIGVTVVQIAWMVLIFGSTPEPPALPLFLALIVAEILVPAWAERHGRTPWHPGHIAERYGLMTIIVLGEAILAATVAVRAATVETGLTLEMLELIVGGLLIVFSMWWYYFHRPVEPLLESASLPQAFTWGYGHYFLFGVGAAVGAGLAVGVELLTGQADIGAFGAGMAVAGPVAGYLAVLWILHELQHPEVPNRPAGPVAAGLVLLTPFTGHAILLTGVILAALLTVKLVRRHRAASV